MIYAVISDVHANASALKKALADAWKQGATQIVCLGDVVGYGPEPGRSVAMLRVEKATVVAGNHDDAVSGRLDASDFIDLAADAVSRHRAALRDDEKEWLGALPYITNIEGDAVCVHGDLTAPREFKYIDTTDDAAANFAVCGNQLIFVGHTHTPCLFVTGKSGKTYKTTPQDFTAEPGKRYIVNVGSIGYPREENGTCVSSYVLYDSERHEVRFRFLPFSVSSVMQRGPAPERPTQAQHKLQPTPAKQPTATDRTARRERRIVLAAICAIVAIFAATMLLVIPRRNESPANHTASDGIKNVKSAIIDSPKKNDVSKVLLLNGNENYVHPNVYLAKKSAPAILTIDFKNQAGAKIYTEIIPFKEYKKKGFPIPPNTHRVEFSVVPQNKGDTIKITSFKPSAK